MKYRYIPDNVIVHACLAFYNWTRALSLTYDHVLLSSLSIDDADFLVQQLNYYCAYMRHRHRSTI